MVATALSERSYQSLVDSLGRDAAYEVAALLPTESVAKYGADPSGTTYSDVAFRKAIAAVRAAGGGTVCVPDGHYRFSDTIVLTNPDSGFECISLLGSAGGYSYASCEFGVLLDFSAMTPDRPAIAVQGSRNSTIEGVVLKGVNLAPLTAGLTPTDDINDWITPNLGITSGRYNPYGGIVVDPWSGTAPGTPYAGATYGRTHSLGVNIRNCAIWGFVAAICVKPADDDNQCDSIAIENTIARGNAYSLSIGTSQARSVTCTNFRTEYNLVNYVGSAHGKQTGCCPAIQGGQSVRSYYLFDFSAGYTNVNVTGFYAETFLCIGQIGKGAVASSYAASFTGCGFRFGSTSVNEDRHPYHVACFMPTAFTGCFFETHGGLFNVAGGREDVAFIGCQFRETASTWNDIYYCARIKDWAEPLVTFQACSWITDYWTGGTNPANNLHNANGITLPSRIEFHPMGSKWFFQPQKLYELIGGANNTYVASTISSPVVAATLSFTATTVAEFAVGDVLYWKTTAMPRCANLQFQVPMARVTGITSNTVTCEWLCNPALCDATFLAAGGSILIAQREWATGSLVTGDTTSGSPSVTNVTSAANFIRVGDFISGVGIPSRTRVTAVSGTTVTLSKNATANGTTELYYGRVRQTVTALTSTATWDPANLATGASATTTITVRGAVLGNRAVAAPSIALPDGFLLTATVSATDTVKVVLANVGGSTTDVSSHTVTVQVFQ